MKLYELAPGSKFKIIGYTTVPPAAREPLLSLTYTLRNIDGMYSRCFDNTGGVYHFAAYTEVELSEENWE